MRDMLVEPQKQAATYLLACHDCTFQLLTGLTNINTVSAGFKLKLSNIVKPLLAGSQLPATMYDIYTATVATALKDELCSIKLDVLAMAMRQKKEQADKIAAAATANTDAEMANGTKTIGELVKLEMQKYHEANKAHRHTSNAVVLSLRALAQGKNLHPARKTSTNTTQSNSAPLGNKPRGGGGRGRGN
ncbi:hypothetical protein B0H13DRAFT_2301535 [Mycena leptocephala]|nr:hypothetical protein B0H13DRAFT_2301535 [Mycena leptocephala]